MNLQARQLVTTPRMLRSILVQLGAIVEPAAHVRLLRCHVPPAENHHLLEKLWDYKTILMPLMQTWRPQQ